MQEVSISDQSLVSQPRVSHVVQNQNLTTLSVNEPADSSAVEIDMTRIKKDDPIVKDIRNLLRQSEKEMSIKEKKICNNKVFWNKKEFYVCFLGNPFKY